MSLMLPNDTQQETLFEYGHLIIPIELPAQLSGTAMLSSTVGRRFDSSCRLLRFSSYLLPFPLKTQFMLRQVKFLPRFPSSSGTMI